MSEINFFWSRVFNNVKRENLIFVAYMKVDFMSYIFMSQASDRDKVHSWEKPNITLSKQSAIWSCKDLSQKLSHTISGFSQARILHYLYLPHPNSQLCGRVKGRPKFESFHSSCSMKFFVNNEHTRS